MAPDPMERPGQWEPGARSPVDGPDAHTVAGQQTQAPYADSEQPDLLEALEAGRRRRDEGQQVATYATDVSWTLAADRAIADLAATGRPFTAEDLRAVVGPPVGSHNSMGPVFMRAARAGLIVGIGYRQATRTEAAGRVLKVWRGAS